MELELKHLVPYLPYKLKCWIKDFPLELGIPPTNGIHTMNSVYFDGTCTFHDIVESEKGFQYIKPILRPLKEIEVYFKNLYGSLDNQDVTEFFDADYLSEYGNLDIEDLQYVKIENIPYGTMQVLLKHHFDVFDLIPKDLAIDINNLNK